MVEQTWQSGMVAAEQRRATIRGWQQTVDAATNRLPAPPGLPAGPVPRIVLGYEATSAPWIARVYRDGKPNGAATMIAPHWALASYRQFTTADNAPLAPGEAPKYTFSIGNVDPALGKQATTHAIFRYPDSDLALIKLDRDVNMKPEDYAPLGDNSMTADGRDAQVYGWGATALGDTTHATEPRILKMADVRIEHGDLFKDELVAVPRNGFSARGDLGGPMMVTPSEMEPYPAVPHLVGVTSSTGLEAVNPMIASYVDVTEPKYQHWIRETMQK